YCAANEKEGLAAMKKLLLTSIATLFLVTGTARAEWDLARHDCILEWHDPGQPATITLKDIPDLLERLKDLKKHCAWLQCLDDREAGKVKHCYANDKRWR